MKKIISLILILGILLQGVLGISNVSADTGSGSTGTGTNSSGATIQEPILQNSDYQIQSTDGLVASYNFNGDTQDSSGNGNHGAASNVTYEDITGTNKKIAAFNGVNSYINFGDNTFKDLYNYSIILNGYKIIDTENNTSPFISVFNNMGNNSSGFIIYILSKDYTTTDNKTYNKGDLLLCSGTNESGNTYECFLSSNQYIEEGKKYNIAITNDYQEKIINLYINGELKDTFNITKNYHYNSTTYSYIGKVKNWSGDTGNGRYLNGEIGELKIYNQALNDGEIHMQNLNAQEYLGLDTNGLVASYDLNGNAQDSSGNANHGTVSNVTYETLSNGNKVASFNGSSYINTGIQDNITNFSICSFVNISSLDGNLISTIVGNYDSPSASHHYGLGVLPTGKVSFFYDRGSTYHSVNGSTELELNKWYSVCGTHNTVTGGKVYLNGIEEGTNTATVTNLIPNKPLYIGRSHYTTNQGYWNGKIGLVSQYDSTLTQPEIDTLYQEGQEYLALVESNGLIASYDLNGDTKDSSGNANHGTASNVTYETLSNGNKVASFDGSSSKVSYPTKLLNTELNGSKAITYQFWVNRNQINSSTEEELLFSSHGQATAQIEIATNNTLRLGGRSQTNDTFQAASSTTQLNSTSDWYHVIAVFDFENSKYLGYINGIKEIDSSVSFGSPTFNINTVNYINGGEYNGNRFYNGKMGLVSMFNKALTQSEIDTLYQEGQEYLGLNIPMVEVPDAPSNFIADNITSEGVTYTWSDNSISTKEEEKFVIKDENGAIIKDNIIADSTNIGESGLQASTEYQRKICAVNSAGEVCSELVTFTTQIEVVEGKTTPFDFMGIVINVIETAQMFKVEFVIGGFKINFSIEKIL